MGKNISNFLFAVIGFLFFVCGAVIFTLNCRTIYYKDMQNQQLEAYLGLPEEEIKVNYDILIDYNLVTKRIDTLEFPTFPMSEQGRIHFEEVKHIFVVIQYLFVITGGFFGLGILWMRKTKEYTSLKWLAVLTFTVPAILGILIGVCWEQVFVLFHKIFFRNDYWLFDPVTDPVILILPDIFFAHCAIVILAVIVLGGIAAMLVYSVIKKKEQKQNPDLRFSRYYRTTTTRR